LNDHSTSCVNVAFVCANAEEDASSVETNSNEHVRRCLMNCFSLVPCPLSLFFIFYSVHPSVRSTAFSHPA
jgi:hypothetical protein